MPGSQNSVSGTSANGGGRQLSEQRVIIQVDKWLLNLVIHSSDVYLLSSPDKLGTRHLVSRPIPLTFSVKTCPPEVYSLADMSKIDKVLREHLAGHIT